jgi:CBS domain-containing protein
VTTDDPSSPIGADGSQRLRAIPVGQAMHPGIVSCRQSASAAEVARVMSDSKVHCVAVIGLSAGEPGQPYVWGIVSDLDLLSSAIDSDGTGTAAELASQPVIAVTPAMSVYEAAKAMVEHGTSHVVVVEGDRRTPVGVLSTLDVAALLARPVG